MPVIGTLFDILSIFVWILSVVLWIVLMIKAYQGARFELPWAGNFAQKLLEQKAK